MLLGALLTALTGASDAVAALYHSGNDALSGLGTVTLLAAVPALITVMAVNSYGAMLTTTAAIGAFRRVPATIATRVAGLIAVAAVSLLLALVIPANALNSFNNFLLLMLYFLIPWTAVNLVDFYFVRRGHYRIVEILKPDGTYGRWGWRGLTAYFAGFLAMVPFFSTTIYTGPVAQGFGGADISAAIGLPVAGLVYYSLSRSLSRVRDTGEQDDANSAVEARIQ
jgi:purine-cytosine permease-like protein